MRHNLHGRTLSREAVHFLLAAGPLVAFLLILAAPATAQNVKLIPHQTTLDVQIDGKLFTTYHFHDNYFHSPVRPFLYPVFAGDGTAVTTDQQQTDPKHGYQRSIWIGHGDVNGTNQWKFTQPLAVQKHIRFDWIRQDGFAEQLVWTDKSGAPIIRETRVLRFLAFRNGNRAISFRITMTPARGDVTFGTRGDHGLLSVRPVESLYHTPVFTAADGSHSCEAQSPHRQKPGDAHSGTAPDPLPGVHVAWCDESGTIQGKTYGIAIFDHPSNPRHPPMWHAHPDARLAIDMFALDRAAAGDRRQGPFTISRGKSVTFRYEIFIHQGPAVQAELATRFASFAKSK